jgi:hypothetical protein
MERDPIMVLLQLGAVAVIAVGAVLLLLRLSARTTTTRGSLEQGYPPSLFPRQDVVRNGPLAALAATQARLLAIYGQAPQQSDLAIWLGPFLRELRQIMDTAYHAATITHAYGQSAAIERLATEIQQIEAQVAEHAVQLLLARDGDAERELLDGRLAALRLCARELGRVAGALPA